MTLALMATACSSGLNDEEQAHADSMAATFTPIGMKSEEAECAAERIVEELGMERLRPSGANLTVDGLSLEDYTVQVEALVGCADWRPIAEPLLPPGCRSDASDEEFQRAARYTLLATHSDYNNPEEEAFVNALGECSFNNPEATNQ